VPLDLVNRSFRAIVVSRWAPCALAFITGPVLLFMQEGAIDDPSGFAPEGRILLAYLIFFGCGWLLWRNADLLPALRRVPRAPVFVAIGVVTALAGYLIWYWLSVTGSRTVLVAAASAWLLALAMWSFVFGLIGIFLQYFDRPDPRIRYLSDSSYWLYLCHMPVLLVFQIAAAQTDWPPAIKAMAVLAATVATLIASYHVLVRPTWVGAILNGQKHPTGMRDALARVARLMRHREARPSRRATL
jgi:peptidoglycan/LPS O-acetylase OafA/YrhL